MRRQQGFVVAPWMAYAAYAIGFLALLGSIIFWADHHIATTAGIEKGVAQERERARILAAARDKDVSDAINEREAGRMAAADRAKAADNRWKEKLREARQVQTELASRVPAPSTPVTPDAANRGPAPGLRVHWRFVGLYDGAFTGLDGKPLYQAQGEFALDPARADTPSQFGLPEVADVSGANNQLHSSCRRDYDTLMGRINAAERAWDKSR